MLTKATEMPFILFGPPGMSTPELRYEYGKKNLKKINLICLKGTGKTRTLAAAMEQIVRTTKENIIVCAMSNAACDEITERLMKVLNEQEMYRLYAKSTKYMLHNTEMMRISNFDETGVFYPPLAYLYSFRVLICTLSTAGILARARADKDVWKLDHFGYVFIDEAASAPEPVTMMPILGKLFRQSFL